MDQDYFPNVPWNGVVEDITKDLSTKSKTLNRLLEANRVIVFVIVFLHGRITTKQMFQKTDVPRYFRNAFREALKLNKFKPNKLYWEKVELRLNGVGEERKSNTDVKTCFRIDNHKFLVPIHFTFGQRTVPQGFVHLIETTVAPICVYRLSTAADTERVVRKDSYFHAADQMWYDRFILQPHTRYQFNPGTVYLFITVQKTLFSLHLLVEPGNEIYGLDPFQHRKLINNPHEMIPATPRVVAMLNNEEPAPAMEAAMLNNEEPAHAMEKAANMNAMEAASAMEAANMNAMEEASMPAMLDDLEAASIPAILDDLEASMPAMLDDLEESMPAMLNDLEAPVDDEELFVPPSVLKKRLLEEIECDRIVKIAKGNYDYPHPDVSTQWKRLDDTMEQCIIKNKLPVQPLDLSLKADEPSKPDEITFDTMIEEIISTMEFPPGDSLK